jgi:hypothetical protein
MKRPKKISAPEWEARRFCSLGCSGKAKTVGPLGEEFKKRFTGYLADIRAKDRARAVASAVQLREKAETLAVKQGKSNEDYTGKLGGRL